MSVTGVELYPSGNLGSGSGQLGGAHHAHRRSLTNLSELGAEKSPESASRVRPPPESLEAQLSHKLQVGARYCSIVRRNNIGCKHFEGPRWCSDAAGAWLRAHPFALAVLRCYAS